ncbi:MAG: alpha/beta fold hydrolase [Candidatus Riflebacteria bacterium]|nr:alpha/beta fold hydrolase [Candidatus Riflebacteria bacterium]
MKKIFLVFLIFIVQSVSGQEVKLEKSPLTGQTFQGIAADGTSTLKLEISLPNPKGKILLKQTALGFLKSSRGSIYRPQDTIVPDSDEKIRLIYQPPLYILDDRLASTNCATPSWKAQETLSFEYISGASSSVFCQKFDLIRPPVIMVHGFTGSRESLASLSAFLQTQKFDTLLEEYYNKNSADRSGSSIEAQAAKLAKHIDTVLNTYNQSGFKLAKIDIVSHSMGGLISRTYLKQRPSENEPLVRKLIMIATPNHGVPWVEKIVGNILADLISKYHQEAANQLFCGNPIFQFLNEGEKSGKHLNDLVQYAIIAGVRHRYSYWDIMGNFLGDLSAAADDDGVVTRDSARLNGVSVFLFGEMVHTYAKELQQLFPKDDPMPRSGRISAIVKKLLLRNIVFVPLKNCQMEIKKAEGEVFLKRTIDEEWQKVSGTSKIFDNSFGIVKTASGSAVTTFSTQGDPWASVMLPPQTEIQISYASPELVRAFVKKGQARFVSNKKGLGSFEIVLGNEGENWMKFSPRAKIRNLSGDFIVSTEGGGKIFSIEEKVSLQAIAEDGSRKNRWISSGKGIEMTMDGRIKTMDFFPGMNVFENVFFKDLKSENSPSTTLESPILQLNPISPVENRDIDASDEKSRKPEKSSISKELYEKLMKARKAYYDAVAEFASEEEINEKYKEFQRLQEEYYGKKQ